MTSEWRDIHARHSVLREVILEHQLTASLLQRLWQRGVFDVEILHSAFDAGGYDLVLSGRSITRHVQLKASRKGASTRSQKVGIALARRQAGCVVWMEVDDGLNILGYRVFIPGPGSFDNYPVARHTKANAEGFKAERPAHRVVPATRFVAVDGLDGLLDKLLGPDAWPAPFPG